MNPENLDTITLLALSGQTLMLFAGCVVLWRVVFSSRTREIRCQPSPLTPWTVALPDFGMALLVVIAGGVAGQIGAQLLAQALNWSDDGQMLLLGAGFQGGLLAGAGIARISVLRTQPPEDTPAAPAPPTPSAQSTSQTSLWIAGPLTLLAALPVLFAVNLVWMFLLAHFGLNTAKQPLVDLFVKAESPGLVLGMSFLAVIVAPLAEEVIFRAGLFRYLRTRVPRWAALTLPALLFGSLHGNLVAFAPLFVLGIVFALAYEHTGRLSVPILAHALFNLNTILLLLAGVEV